MIRGELTVGLSSLRHIEIGGTVPKEVSMDPDDVDFHSPTCLFIATWK